jgi:hypothetical protein
MGSLLPEDARVEAFRVHYTERRPGGKREARQVP